MDDWTLKSNGINFDGSIPAGEPFTQTWRPVSYRAAYTYEPIPNMMFYSMYATSYDPAAADVFSVNASVPLALTSAAHLRDRRQATVLGQQGGVDFRRLRHHPAQCLRADRTRRRSISPAKSPPRALNWPARCVRSKTGSSGPIVALTHARYEDFDGVNGNWTGNTPSNVAPVIFNAGASYRFEHWQWPVEIGGSVRHVGNRYLFEDDATTMDAYTTADAYAFVDIPGKDFGRPEIKKHAHLVPRPQPDQRRLRRVFRSGLSGPGLSRRSAHLRACRFGQVVKHRRNDARAYPAASLARRWVLLAVRDVVRDRHCHAFRSVSGFN